MITLSITKLVLCITAVALSCFGMGVSLAAVVYAVIGLRETSTKKSDKRNNETAKTNKDTPNANK